MQWVQQVLGSPGAAAPQEPKKPVSQSTWPKIQELTPRRQAAPSTETQLQVRAGLANLNLTSSRRISPRPRNGLTASVARFDIHRSATEPIAKDIAHIIPDLVAVKSVRENGLADIRHKEAVIDGCHFERYASADRVAAEGFAVALIFGDHDFGTDGPADRPEVDGTVALICNDCTADGLRGGHESGKSEDLVEKHSACYEELL